MCWNISLLVLVGFGLLGCQETERDLAYLFFFFFKLLFLIYSESSLDTEGSGLDRFGEVLFFKSENVEVGGVYLFWGRSVWCQIQGFALSALGIGVNLGHFD